MPPPSKSHLKLLVVVTLSGCLWPKAATAQVAALPWSYTLTQVTTSGSATGLNAFGQVAGGESEYSSNRPFLWTPTAVNAVTGSLTELTEFSVEFGSAKFATGINDRGQISVAAEEPSGISQVYLWSPAAPNGLSGTIVSVAAAGPYSTFPLNNFGQVGGYLNGAWGIWTPSAANGNTGAITSNSQFQRLIQMNSFGQGIMGSGVNGLLFTPSTANTGTGTFTTITGLAGSQDTGLGAINDKGAIAGYSCVTQSTFCQTQAFVWTPATPNAATGTAVAIPLPSGIQWMTPTGMNNQGDVVGTMAQSGGGNVPFLYTGGTVYDLTSISGLLSNATPVGINGAGQMVFNTDSGVYLATIDQPAALPPANAVPVTIASNTASAFVVTGAGCAPGGYATPQTLKWSPGASCTVSFVSPYSLQLGVQYVFSGWQDGALSNPRVIATPAQATTYTASFHQQFYLTAQANPGAGGSVAGGGWFGAGTSATMTATPAAAYRFVYWTGGSYTTANPAQVTVNGPLAMTADFASLTNALPGSYALTQVTTSARATGLNAFGQVAGIESASSRPYLWTPVSANGTTGSLTELAGFSAGSTAYDIASGVNDLGQVAVNTGGSGQVYLWTPSAPNGTSGTIVSIASGAALAIPVLNNFGQVGGYMNGAWEIWTPSAANGSAGAITGNSQFDGLTKMNSFGQAIGGAGLGFSGSACCGPSGVLFTPATANSGTGTFTTITGLAGSQETALQAMNDKGTIAGYSCVGQSSSNCQNQAFVWTPTAPNAATGAAAAIPPPNGFQSMSPTAMNNAGDLVGTMVASGGSRVPFLYTGGTVYDLSSISGLLSNALPVGINGAGQMVFNTSSGVYLATLLQTTPSPVTVTINSAPSGLSFTADGSSYTTPFPLQWTAGTTHWVSFASVAPVAGGRDGFVNWSDGDKNATREFASPSVATTYTANFVTQYPLTLQANPAIGGVIWATPPSADGFYNTGSNVQVSAMANSADQFTGFSEDLSGSNPSQPLVMSAAHKVTANFQAVQNPSLTTAIVNNVSAAAQPSPNVTVAIRLTNSGQGAAKGIQLTAVSARILAPVPGTASVNMTLPFQAGDLAAGATGDTIYVPIGLAATARRVVLQIDGTMKNSAGTLFKFSNSATIIR